MNNILLLRILFASFLLRLQCIWAACNHHSLIVNPQAKFFIDTFLPLVTKNCPDSEELDASHFEEGVLQFEAIRWSLERTNKFFGQIGSRIVQESFVPGIIIGLRVFNTCEFLEGGTTGSEDYVPCPNNPEESTVGSLGFDSTTKKRNRTPADLSLSPRLNIPTKDRASAILQFLNAFGWQNVSILVEEEDESAIELVQIVMNEAEHWSICISNVINIPPTKDFITQGKQWASTLLKDDVLTSTVLILGGTSTLQVIRELEAALLFTADPSNVILTELPSSGELKYFDTLLLKFWIVTNAPTSIIGYDQRWQEHLYNINSFKETKEDTLLITYMERTFNCTTDYISNPSLQSCSNIQFPSEPTLFKLKQNEVILSALHSTYTLINSFKLAWKELCSKSGSCEKLNKLTREEFQNKFLNKHEFRHKGPGSRSPPELTGMKQNDSKLHDSLFSFYKIEKKKRSLQVEKVLSVDSSGIKIANDIIFNDHKLQGGSNCFKKTPTTDFPILRTSTTPAPPVTPVVIKDFPLEREVRESFISDEKFVYISSPDNVLLIGLFPVHEPSKDGAHCSHIINRKGVQEVEAFLWAIDQLNRHPQVLPNTNLGTIVLDTCGSKIKTLNQVTNLIRNSYPGLKIDLSNVLAMVSSSDLGISRVLGETLASLNITVLNLGMSDLLNPFSLQMKRSVNEEAEAIVQISHHIGWKFVSLLTSIDDLESKMGSDAFKNVAKASKICVAEEIKLKSIDNSTEMYEKLVSELSDRSEWGVRVFVVFLTENHVDLLLKTLQKGVESRVFRADQFIIIGSTSWGDTTEKFSEFGNLLGGLLLLKDGQRIVDDFTIAYRVLNPDQNLKNPWFEEYWMQEFDCPKQSCLKSESYVLPSPASPSVPRVIQSVFSFGAALTQLLDHLCPHAGGKMCPGLPVWRQRVVINEFLRNTEVSRVDEPSRYFQFTDNFHGNAPLKVLNLASGNAQYIEIGHYIDSHLEMETAFGSYVNGSLFPMNSFTSACTNDCHYCHDLDSEFLFIKSKHQLYVLVIFDIHDKGDKILECGPMRSDQGIQNVESLLWSLEEVNRNSTVEIGALIYDSCWSNEKVVKDISNLLSGRLPSSLKKKIPSLDHIIGIICGSRGTVLKQILDVTRQYLFTTVATQASQSFTTDDQLYPTLITLAPSNAAYARAIAALATYWKWQQVSVVYSNFGDSKDVYKSLKRNLYESGVKISTTSVISKHVYNIELMLDIWTDLAEGAEKGSRVIILLLENPHELLFLQTASKLLQERLIRPADFLYVTAKAIKPFVKNEVEALGSVTIQPMIGLYEGFAQHFKNLSIVDRKSPYPWFQEFWSKINGCQGADCQKVSEVTLKNYPFRQAKGVVETANAVRLFSNILTKVIQSQCQELEKKEKSCQNISGIEEIRDKVHALARVTRLEGADKQPVEITTAGYNAAATLQILNFRKLANDRAGLVRIGLFNDMKELVLNGSKVVTYDEKGHPIKWNDIPSDCLNHDNCVQETRNDVVPYVKVESETAPIFIRLNKTGEGYTQIYPFERFGISVFLPLHRQNEDNFFACDGFFSESVFQNLVAVSYALSRINANNPGIGIGAIIFDFCNRLEKARGQAFSYFSGELQNNYEDILMTKERVFASVTLSDTAAEAISTVLSSNYIPQFSSPVAGRRIQDRNKYSSVVSSIPTRSAEIRVYMSLLKTFKWKYVSVLFDNDEVGQSMAQLLRSFAHKEDICIGDSLSLPRRLSEEFSHDVVHTLSAHWKPRVVIVLMRDFQNIQTLLKVFAAQNQSENFIFVSGNSWGNDGNISQEMHRIAAGALTFSLETYDLPEFREYLANLTLKNHDPIDRSLFEEYHQYKYKCRLPNSSKALEMFTNTCTETETTHSDDVIQDPFVFHTVLAVNTIAHGLDSYLSKRCMGSATSDNCKIIHAELFLELMENAKKHLNNTLDTNSYDRTGAFGYYIWNYRKIGREYGYVNIGKWENGRLNLETSAVQFKLGPYIPQSLCLRGRCLETCAFQSPIYATLQIPIPKPIDHNFRSIYGIVTGSLNLVGIILILIVIVYFMILFPTIEGTSLLGYFILIGCLIIYSVNFAFIFQPSIGMCALRRLLMGVGYAFVHSALLIKVINSWRLASYHKSDFHLAKPGMIALVFGALVLVQIILGVAWLTLYPPMVDLIGDQYKCSPSETFEKELVISLAYVMLLNIVTLIFCAETWHYSDVLKETRWVLSAELCVGFSWILWISVSIQGPDELCDPAIVIGNISSATAILLFLYSRRSYIYSHLTEEMKDLDVRSHLTSATDANSSQNKLTDQDLLRTQTINPIRESMPGTQFVGCQEVSFRTVTLPPEDSYRSSSRLSRHSLHNLAFREELQDELAFSVFDSSASSIEDGEFVSSEDYEVASQYGNAFGVRRSSLRNLGSGQMLVYLTDGKSIGEVSRI